jgi:hypothetical protein
MIDMTTISPANPLQRKIMPQKATQSHPYQDGFSDVMREKGHTLPEIADDQPHDQEEEAEANADCCKMVDPVSVMLPQLSAMLPDSIGILRHIGTASSAEEALVTSSSSDEDDPGSLQAGRKSNRIGAQSRADSRQQELMASEESDNSTILSGLKQVPEQNISEDPESSTLALARRRQLPIGGVGEIKMTTPGDEAVGDAVQTELASPAEQQRRPVGQDSIPEQRRGGHVSDQVAATLNILSPLQPSVTAVGTPAEQITDRLATIITDPTAWQTAMGKPEAMASLTVVLEPESLGPVRVSLVRRGDGLHITISAGKQGTAEMLQRDKDQLNVLLQAITDKGQITAITISTAPVHEGQEFHSLSERLPDRGFQELASGSQPRQPQPEHKGRSFPHKEEDVDEAARRMTSHEDPSIPGHALSGVVIV